MVVERLNEQPKTSRPWWAQLRACAKNNDMVFAAAPVNFMPSSLTVSSWCSPSSCVHDLADVNLQQGDADPGGDGPRPWSDQRTVELAEAHQVRVCESSR